MNNAHEFALYLKDLSVHLIGKTIGENIAISDPALMQRMSAILRLKIHETVRLFDHEYNALVELVAFEKKQILGIIRDIVKNNVIKPAITVLLPILKREALSEAVYSCAEMGATRIQLLVTEKSQRMCNSEHIKKIIIAAAEQSKQFSMPVVHEPIVLEQGLKPLSVHDKLFFDPEGLPVASIIQKIERSKNIVLLVGPEGDLTNTEKKLIKDYGFVSCALTPTILRASQAVAVGLGLLRSMIRD